MALPPLITARELLERYDTLLLDAYGVLVHAAGAIEGSVAFIDCLNACQKNYFIVTNGSIATPEITAQRYRRHGLNISAGQVISSGSLAANWIHTQGLSGCRVRLLGPETCQFMLQATNCQLITSDDADYELLLIGNQDGFPFMETMDQVISNLFRLIDKGQNVHLLLPNPDFLYPAGAHRVGITTGMLAYMIEAALDLRYTSAQYRFTKLGKPYAPIFMEAKKRAASTSLVMIGDQMATDIRGAKDAGLDSVLIGTGIAPIEDVRIYQEFQPSYRMKDFSLKN